MTLDDIKGRTYTNQANYRAQESHATQLAYEQTKRLITLGFTYDPYLDCWYAPELSK